ncbi:MAG: enoyl-CoA hydratase [Acidimicrobiia bacterium]
MYQHITVGRVGSSGRITLNRPEKRNALSGDLMNEVSAALRDLAADAEIQAIVVEGTGPAFSAGHDMTEMRDRDLGFYQQLFDTCIVMMDTIQKVPQPVIAKVQGLATAAGCQLVAACDLAVAAEDAWFATPGVKIGLFCSTPMVPISRAIGRKRAMEMLLTGEPISAATAADWGLVNRVVPATELEQATQDLVDRITRYSPVVIGIGKEAFYTQIELDEHGAYAHTRDVMSVNATMDDAREGIGAFLDKRVPVWAHTEGDGARDDS